MQYIKLLDNNNKDSGLWKTYSSGRRFDGSLNGGITWIEIEKLHKYVTERSENFTLHFPTYLFDNLKKVDQARIQEMFPSMYLTEHFCPHTVSVDIYVEDHDNDMRYWIKGIRLEPEPYDLGSYRNIEDLGPGHPYYGQGG